MSLHDLHAGLRLDTSGIVLPLAATTAELRALGITPWPTLPGEASRAFESEDLFGLFADCWVHAQYIEDGRLWYADLTISGITARQGWESAAEGDVDAICHELEEALGPRTGTRSWGDDRVRIDVHTHESGYWDPVYTARMALSAVRP